MNVAGNFFSRYKNIPKIFDNPCSPKTGIVVVIPCYNDPHIFNTLESLESNKISYPEINIEVIVVVNSSIDTGSEILHINKEIYNKLLKQKDNNFYKNFKLLPCIFENIPPKIAGVGYARKIGMDEALRRFDEINNPDGVIISLDADTIVSKEYFNTIIDEFYIQKKVRACVFQFTHNFNSELYSEKEIEACKKYEAYLRYFKLCLKYCGYSTPIHTIGSCFGVKAPEYAKSGGMSCRQGGEDFYFLHKLSSLTRITEIKKIIVFPSPRVSDRVPFGTGPAVKKIIESKEYKVYNFALFEILKNFFSNIELYFLQENNKILQTILAEIIEFTGKEKIIKLIEEIKRNCSNLKSFEKRFFFVFDAFFIIKFLNFSSEKFGNLRNQEISEAISLLLSAYKKNYFTQNYDYFDSIKRFDIETL